MSYPYNTRSLISSSSDQPWQINQNILSMQRQQAQTSTVYHFQPTSTLVHQVQHDTTQAQLTHTQRQLQGLFQLQNPHQQQQHHVIHIQHQQPVHQHVQFVHHQQSVQYVQQIVQSPCIHQLTSRQFGGICGHPQCIPMRRGN